MRKDLWFCEERVKPMIGYIPLTSPSHGLPRRKAEDRRRELPTMYSTLGTSYVLPFCGDGPPRLCGPDSSFWYIVTSFRTVFGKILTRYVGGQGGVPWKEMLCSN